MVVGSHQGVPGSSPGARTNYPQLHPSSQDILLLLSHLRSSRFHAVACTNPLFSYPYSHVSVREPQVLSYLLPMLPASFFPCVLKRSEGMKGYCQYYDAEFEHEYILLQTTMSLGFLTHSSPVVRDSVQ